MRIAALTGCVAIALSAQGCSDPGASNGTSGAGLARGSVTIETAEGALRFEVEIAETESTRERGLMGRESLPEGEGMVFLFDSPSESSFGMADTLIPLSIVFWNSNGEVVDVLDMQPCEPDACPAYRSAAEYVGALEVNRGALAGVVPGDVVRFERG